MREGKYTGAKIGEPNIKYVWYKNDIEHREDGPAIELFNGTKYWCFNGKLHRKNGPAIESTNNSSEWWINGQLHREDGPAIEWKNGVKYWYYYGQYIDCQSQEDFERIIKLLAFK